MAVVVPVLIVGWFLVRDRVRAIAAEREGFTGAFPVVVSSSVAERGRRRDERPGSSGRVDDLELP